MTDAFVCPRCRTPVERAGDAWTCGACGHRYPIVLDIPDFRIAPDPWIGVEDDRAKGLRLERETEGKSFGDMVRAYWAMTPDTPRELADRFIAQVLGAEQRSREWTDAMLDGAAAAPPSGTRRDSATRDSATRESATRESATRDSATNETRATRPSWLDIGCGTAPLAAAMGDRADITSIDVAFRWLVVARRRLMQRGITPHLVCCNAEALPFADATFDGAFSMAAIEHVSGQRAMLGEAHRVLRDGGTLQLRTVNRYSLLPEPHVNVWGVGLLPRSLASAWVHLRTGRHYVHHRNLGARELRAMLRDAAFTSIHVSAAQLLPADRARLHSTALSTLIPLYQTLQRSSLLALVTPELDATARVTRSV